MVVGLCDMGPPYEDRLQGDEQENTERKGAHKHDTHETERMDKSVAPSIGCNFAQRGTRSIGRSQHSTRTSHALHEELSGVPLGGQTRETLFQYSRDLSVLLINLNSLASVWSPLQNLRQARCLQPSIAARFQDVVQHARCQNSPTATRFGSLVGSTTRVNAAHPGQRLRDPPCLIFWFNITVGSERDTPGSMSEFDISLRDAEEYWRAPPLVYHVMTVSCDCQEAQKSGSDISVLLVYSIMCARCRVRNIISARLSTLFWSVSASSA